MPGFDALPAMADELCDVVRGPITDLTEPGSACTTMAVGNGALSGLGFADAAFTEARLQTVLQETNDYSILTSVRTSVCGPGMSCAHFWF